MSKQENLVVCYKQAVVEQYLIDEIHAAWPEVNIINVGQKDVAAALLDADFFCGHVKVPADWDRVVKQGRLKWIQSSAAGMDWVLVPSVINSDIVITAAAGALADQVAEHTLALILAWKRNLPSFFADQFGSLPPNFNFTYENGLPKSVTPEPNTPEPKTPANNHSDIIEQSIIDKDNFVCENCKKYIKQHGLQLEQNRVGFHETRKFKRLPTHDLTRNTVGIVGFGGVGRRLAQLLSPFGVKIIATDLFPVNKPDTVSELLGPEKLDYLLAESDVVVLCLPLNSSTRYIFDSKKFEKMKSGALLANVARGALVVTADLVTALEKGRPAGAVIDVCDPEPLPREHPLWNAPNVIITPHVGGQAAWRFETINKLFIENIRRRKAGEQLINSLSQEGKRLGFPLRNGETPLWTEIGHY
ncbi:MAG: NAD(P)-dependent oxidoreductase [Thermoguttaceae bacterium]